MVKLAYTNNMDTDVLEFTAVIAKVQQLQTDLSIRLTLDLPEHMTLIMAELAECKRQGAELHITATPIFADDKTGRFDT